MHFLVLINQTQIVQNAAEEYEKLCKVLSHMAECLPRIELYTETFLESDLVQNCVNTFYCSILRFWTRACKFYRRRRLWNILRVVWNDYDAEFGDLELEMHRCRDAVESNQCHAQCLVDATSNYYWYRCCACRSYPGV